MLRQAIGLMAVGGVGLLAAVAAFGQGPPPGKRPPPGKGPLPCHGFAPCPPTKTVTTTVAQTTTVSSTTTVSTTTTVAHTTTAARTTTLQAAAPPAAAPSAPAPYADVSVAVDAPAGAVFAADEVTLTATVTNAGPAAATGVYLGVVPAGSRVLSSAGTDLGTLGPGDSATATVTLAPVAPGTMSATFTAGADEPDPQPLNNVAVVTAPVLAGHAGPPALQTASEGAFAPPLLAVRKGSAWVVRTTVHVDEPAAVTVRVLDRAGKPQSMLPGTLVGYLPAMRPHLVIPHTLDAGAWMPLQLRVGGSAGRSYRIVVGATGPDGSAASTTIAFRIP